MNMEKAKTLLPIITAFANGETVQFKTTEDGEWRDSTAFSFIFPPNQYRIKPKPIEMWIGIYKSGYCVGYPTEQEARLCLPNASKYVHMREVEK